MKLNVSAEAKFKKELEDNINHYQSHGLPLTSIDLDASEWAYYTAFRQRLVGGTYLELTPSQLRGTCEYMGVEIRRGI